MAVEIGLPAAGVSMTCLSCGRCEVADPLMDVPWRSVFVLGEVYHFCPAEFPPGDVRHARQVQAWVRCFELVFAKRGHYN